MKKLEHKYKKSSRIIAKAELSYWGMVIDVLVCGALGAILALIMVYAPQIEGVITKSATPQYLTAENLKWALLAIGILTILVLTIHFLVIQSKELIVTEKDFLYRKGRFEVNSHIIPLDEIKLIQSKQNLIGQLTRSGTLIITSEGDAKLIIKGIIRPEKLVSKVIAQSNKQKHASPQNLNFNVK